jgi:integrase
VVDDFLSYSAERVGKKVRVLYAQYLKNFAVKHGSLLCQQVTGPLVESYSRNPYNPTARKAKWAESTRSTFLAVVIRAFRHAERAGLIEKSPLLHLKRPAIPKRSADVLISEEEFRKLYEASTEQFRPIFRFIWLTGCRPGEAAQVTAGDVNWELGTVTVRQHKTLHQGDRRTLYLTPDALALLKGLAETRPTGYLFRNRYGNKWSTVTLDGAMRSSRERAGVGGKVLYGCRHSFLTDALAAGVPDAQVAELAGHKGTRTLHASYSHLKVKAQVLREAAKRVR